MWRRRTAFAFRRLRNDLPLRLLLWRRADRLLRRRDHGAVRLLMTHRLAAHIALLLTLRLTPWGRRRPLRRCRLFRARRALLTLRRFTRWRRHGALLRRRIGGARRLEAAFGVETA